MAKVKINDIEYEVEIRNGERFINGQTVDEFMNTLDGDTLNRFAELGVRKITAPITGEELHLAETLVELEFRDY